MPITILEKAKNHPSPDETFRSMCTDLAKYLAAEGNRQRPFRSSDLPCFSMLPEAEKRAAIAHIGFTLEVFNEAREEGFSLKDTRKLVWRALVKSGCAPLSDFFDKIEDEAVVGFFGPDHRVIFMNLSFYSWVSFTVEEIFTGYWYRLYRFSNEIADQIYATAVSILAGEKDCTFDPCIPEHLCEELESDAKLRFLSKHLLFSPIKKEGRTAGYLAVFRCRNLES